MNYKKVKNDNGTYDIVEVKTELRIIQNLPEQSVKNTLRKLNFGGAFDGYTPDFFMNRVRFYD